VQSYVTILKKETNHNFNRKINTKYFGKKVKIKIKIKITIKLLWTQVLYIHSMPMDRQDFSMQQLNFKFQKKRDEC